MARLTIAAIALVMSAFSFACVKKIAVPEGQPPHIVDPYAAWSRVLSESVDEKGRVDFEGVTHDPEDLEQWVSYIAEVGPSTRPDEYLTDDDKLAYYIDAYNGLAMYTAIVSGLVPKQKLRFFFLRKVTVDGQQMTLYQLENKVIRPMADARIHCALNCMSVGCPRLPQVPWDGERLDEQLDAAAKEFFNSDKYVQINESEKTVRLSEILKFYTEDFVAEAPTLIDYVNKWRDEKIPAGYKHEFIPYDWTRNDQPKDGDKDVAAGSGG